MKSSNVSTHLLMVTSLSALLLSGCATQTTFGPAPVVDRSSALGENSSLEEPAMRLTPGMLTDSGRLHTVAPGDTLYNISVRYGLDPSMLAALNAISDPTQLRLGQVLKLPVSVTAPRAYTPNPNIRVTEVADGRSTVSSFGEPDATGAQPVSLDDGASVVAVNQPTQGQSAPVTKPEATPAAPVVSAPVAAAPVAEPATPAPKIVPGTRMIWPLQGKILTGFNKDSKGIDIAGIKGDVVVSAMAGEVFYVGNGIAEYGNLVIVKHSPTLVTAYAHNSKIVVKQHQRVKAGEKIAEVGDTGTNRQMLHFEVREKGTPVDPMMYLPRR